MPAKHVYSGVKAEELMNCTFSSICPCSHLYLSFFRVLMPSKISEKEALSSLVWAAMNASKDMFGAKMPLSSALQSLIQVQSRFLLIWIMSLIGQSALRANITCLKRCLFRKVVEQGLIYSASKMEAPSMSKMHCGAMHKQMHSQMFF